MPALQPRPSWKMIGKDGNICSGVRGTTYTVELEWLTMYKVPYTMAMYIEIRNTIGSVNSKIQGRDRATLNC